MHFIICTVPQTVTLEAQLMDTQRWLRHIFQNIIKEMCEFFTCRTLEYSFIATPIHKQINPFGPVFVLILRTFLDLCIFGISAYLGNVKFGWRTDHYNYRILSFF